MIDYDVVIDVFCWVKESDSSSLEVICCGEENASDEPGNDFLTVISSWEEGNGFLVTCFFGVIYAVVTCFRAERMTYSCVEISFAEMQVVTWSLVVTSCSREMMICFEMAISFVLGMVTCLSVETCCVHFQEISFDLMLENGFHEETCCSLKVILVLFLEN